LAERALEALEGLVEVVAVVEEEVVALPRCHPLARLTPLASPLSLAPLTARRIHRCHHNRRLTSQNICCL
jgi:hypothetical protein